MVIEGRLIAQSISETGSIFITNELNTFSGTVLNQGAYHAQHNPDCTEAKFVSSFNNNDPGFSFTATNFVLFDDGVVLGNLGTGSGGDVTEENLQSIRTHMPSGNFAVQSCLEKCGLAVQGSSSTKRL